MQENYDDRDVQINLEMEQINKWLLVNRLSLNIGKNKMNGILLKIEKNQTMYPKHQNK